VPAWGPATSSRGEHAAALATLGGYQPDAAANSDYAFMPPRQRREPHVSHAVLQICWHGIEAMPICKIGGDYALN
jgi:hypothetical protein